jgi:plastocyanin
MTMKRAFVPIALSAALVLALTLAPAGAAPRPKTVRVGDVFFAPDALTVRKGTTVRFKWVGEMAHDVTKSRGPGRFFQSRTRSGDGVLYKRKFRKVGRYRLICTVHPDQMRMSLRVKRKRRRG